MLAAVSVLVWLLSLGVLSVGVILFFMPAYRRMAWRTVAASVGVWIVSVVMLIVAPKPPPSSASRSFSSSAVSAPTPVERAAPPPMPPPPAPLWSKSGRGDDVFDMPTHVRRVRVAALHEGNGANFIVSISGDNVINVLLGTHFDQTKYEGTLRTRGGEVEISRASGVAWLFEEVR